MLAACGATDMTVGKGAATRLSPISAVGRQGPGLRERGAKVKAGESPRDQKQSGQSQDKGDLIWKWRRLKEKGWENTQDSGDRAWERAESKGRVMLSRQQEEGRRKR